MQKLSELCHRRWRTKAMASEKVGWGLSYQAALRTGMVSPDPSWWAARVTQENSPKSSGVVRAMA